MRLQVFLRAVGPDILKSVGIAAFDVGGQQRLVELLSWIEKK